MARSLLSPLCGQERKRESARRVRRRKQHELKKRKKSEKERELDCFDLLPPPLLSLPSRLSMPFVSAACFSSFGTDAYRVYIYRNVT